MQSGQGQFQYVESSSLCVPLAPGTARNPPAPPSPFPSTLQWYLPSAMTLFLSCMFVKSPKKDEEEVKLLEDLRRLLSGAMHSGHEGLMVKVGSVPPGKSIVILLVLWPKVVGYFLCQHKRLLLPHEFPFRHMVRLERPSRQEPIPLWRLFDSLAQAEARLPGGAKLQRNARP